MKAKKDLMKVEPYRGELSRRELARRLGLKEEEILPLHANENLFIEKEWVKERIKEALEKIDPRMYPDPQNVEVRRALAQYYGVDEEEVVMGSGADELIDGISRCFIESGEQIVTLDPTFQVYGISAMLHGGRCKSVLLKEDFSIDVARLLSELDETVKVLYICSPNNPTGNQHEKGVVEEVIGKANCIVVLDEAYVEFADYSLSKLIHEYDNLIVLRTFSKGFGIAGLRFGVALSNQEIADIMRRGLQPYNVSNIAQYTALTLLEHWSYLAEKINEIKRQREALLKELSEIEGLKAYPSKANFILVRIVKRGVRAEDVQKKLMMKGILVRDRSGLPLLDNCLRITVCPNHMTERLTSALKEALGD
ncbi:MAG: histidinol-phosphate transaminase [Candidatus Jordarchaeales archaeon]|nr:histidinol-phosphate transaminase [Candidatus Jordarchaeia archaeon]